MSTAPAPDPVPAPPAPDPAPPAPDPDPPAFQPITSQEQFDRMIQDRIARVKSTPPADYAELQAAAAKLREIELEGQTELERERSRADEAEQKIAANEARMKEIVLRSAILAEAGKADRRIIDPEAVVTLLDRSTLELDDDGNPTNVAKAMDSLLEARPYLVAPAETGRRGSADQGARAPGPGGQLTESELEGMSPEQIVQARRDGKLVDLGFGGRPK